MAEPIVTHLIMRQDSGYAVFSPQLPELLAAYSSTAEVKRDLASALQWAGWQPGGVVVQHDEIVRHDGEILVRWSQDEHAAERLEVAERLSSAMAVPDRWPRCLPVRVGARAARCLSVASRPTRSAGSPISSTLAARSLPP